jgi:hypothetical protein
MKTLLYITLATALSISAGFAQETLNTYDPNSFIFGGDQGHNTLTVKLQTISLIDVEPDPGNTVGFGIVPDKLEAGLPAVGSTGSGTEINEDLWLNFTYRARHYANATIRVHTNQPVPPGITIKVQIINTAGGGDYPKNPNYNPILLNETKQVIVYDFASGYTGDGENFGYQLRYTIDNQGGASLPEGFEIRYEISHPIIH